MLSIALSAITLLLVVAAVLLYRRRRARQIYETNSITPQMLHTMLESGAHVELFDVRMPLDVLVDSEIIPGATRVSPGEIQQNPALLPQDRDTVIYCTCPSDETSQRIVLLARAMGFTRVRLLRGGLDGWRAAGYPVRPYKDAFELNSIV